jgi:hypothetical protein
MHRWTRGLAAPGALVAVLVLSLLLSGCSDKKKSSAKKKGEETTTTTVAAESGPPQAGPLTGTNVAASKAIRPLLVVKVDNDPKARPQAGINQADVVVEEMVEGGVTRFMAIYQSADAESVGPVRSVRSTDVNFATSLNRPLFAYSGANSVFKILLRKAVFFDVGFEALPEAYQRKSDRPAPSNLFTSTGALFAKAPTGAPAPSPFWAFRPAGTAAPGTAAASASIDFRGRAGTKVVWTWDGAGGGWKRTQNGTAHVDAAGAAVAPRNVVIQFVPYVDSKLRDRTEAAVPEAELVGQGEAWFLTDGKVVKGKWDKPSITKPTAYLDAAGQAIALTPGQTWVELAPTGSAKVPA